MAGMEDQDFACAGYDRPRRFPFNRVWLSTATVARVLSPICAPTDRPTALAHRAVPCTVDTAAISSMHVKTEHHHRSESRQTAGCTDTLLADGRTEEGVAKTCGPGPSPHARIDIGPKTPIIAIAHHYDRSSRPSTIGRRFHPSCSSALPGHLLAIPIHPYIRPPVHPCVSSSLLVSAPRSASSTTLLLSMPLSILRT